MGRLAHPAALFGGFLGDAGDAGFCGRKLDFPDRPARGGDPNARASASHKEGAIVEGAAGIDSVCSGYRVPVLCGAVVDPGFTMLLPGLRSGEELGAKLRV